MTEVGGGERRLEAAEKGNPRFTQDVCIANQTEKGEGVEASWREKEEKREEGGEGGGGGGRWSGLPIKVFQIA
jgi:hypothetical protein